MLRYSAIAFLVQLLAVRGQNDDWSWDSPFSGEVVTQPSPNEGSGESEPEPEPESESEPEPESSNQGVQWPIPRIVGLTKTIASPPPAAWEVIKKLYTQGTPMEKSLATLFLDESVKTILLSRAIAEKPAEAIWLPRTPDAYDREISAIDTFGETSSFRTFLDTLNHAPRTVEGSPIHSLNWNIGDPQKRPFGSVIDTCQLDLGSCVSGETINKLLIRFIETMDAGQKEYLNVYREDKFFWSPDYLSFLLKSYHSTGIRSLGADRQRFLFGKLTLQNLIDTRQTRLAVSQLQESVREQIISTVTLANQITGSLNKLKLEVMKSKFPSPTRSYQKQPNLADGIVCQDVSNSLREIMRDFGNSTLSIQEALILVRDVHSSVQAIYQIYQKYYLKYGVLIAVILVSVLVLNEAFKLLVSLCLFVSREYSVVKEFVTYR